MILVDNNKNSCVFSVLMDKAHVAALLRAVDLAGSQTALATLLRDAGHPTVSQQTVSYWITNEVLLDPEWWPLFERATSNAVTRNDLRPDVFLPEHRLVG